MNVPRGTRIITVGDEILGGFITDTNSRHIAKAVFEAGFPTLGIEIVGDKVEAISAAIKRAIAHDDAARIVVCGGVGPTHDDRTLEGVAAGLERPLEQNPDAYAHIESIVQRMHAAGWLPSAEVSEPNRKMSVVPRGAVVLENRRGMAPPLAYEFAAERWLFVLPGVPRELTTVVDEVLIPTYFIGENAPTIGERRYQGVPEATFSPVLSQLVAEFPNVSVGSYPQSQTRDLLIRVRGDDAEHVDAALRRLDEISPAQKKEESQSSPL